MQIRDEPSEQMYEFSAENMGKNIFKKKKIFDKNDLPKLASS